MCPIDIYPTVQALSRAKQTYTRCTGYLDYPFKNPTFSTVCFLSALILLFGSDAGKLSHGMHPIFLLKVYGGPLYQKSF